MRLACRQTCEAFSGLIIDVWAAIPQETVPPLNRWCWGVLGRWPNKPQGTLSLCGLQIPALSLSLDFLDDRLINPFLPKLHLVIVFYHSNRHPKTSYHSVHTTQTTCWGHSSCVLGTVLTLSQWSCLGSLLLSITPCGSPLPFLLIIEILVSLFLLQKPNLPYSWGFVC